MEQKSEGARNASWEQLRISGQLYKIYVQRGLRLASIISLHTVDVQKKKQG